MMVFGSPRYVAVFVLVVLLGRGSVQAQQAPYDPSWYQPDRPYVKIAVVEDGVYTVSGLDVQQAGVSLASVDPTTLRLIENGREIPIWVEGDTSTFTTNDALVFVGRRNRGRDERWVYQDDPSLQSSTFHSLYSDTTYYWLTWGAQEGLRYTVADAAPRSEFQDLGTVRDTVHLERDERYFYGDSGETGHPLYTRGEGFYWDLFSHGNTDPIERTYTLPLHGRVGEDVSLHLSVQLKSESASRHRVTLEVERTTDEGATTFQEIDEVDWTGWDFGRLEASISQDQLPDGDQLRLRVVSHNEFNGVPNRVLLDWVEASYVRRLDAQVGEQRFSVAETGSYNLRLTGHDEVVHVFEPRTQDRFEVSPSEGAAVFADQPDEATVYWAAERSRFKTPVAVVRDAPSDLANSASEADYVVLTTQKLMPSAEALATYRSTHNGFAVKVVDVQDVYDQFDYGRPTPVAIRRFVRQTQQWQRAPRFLAIWGDAPYPADTERALSDWAVPSFGYSPSDGWFAMQADGPEDWSEILAVGRLTVRDNEEGFLFLEKLTTYESVPRSDWQKRMLLMVGGSSTSQQSILQSHTLRWGEAATDPVGMDTLRFFKQAFQPLDPSFQDSLRADLHQGTGWINYFGHSAAQTWEILTDPPAEFNNAGRLPLAVSLGCFTGAFAGGRFEVRSLPSFGEQLVIGSLNGAIAHFGSSEKGSLGASARLNDELVQSVFGDTLRVLGRAVQEAKNRFAGAYDDYNSVKHALQYGLIGDPATRLALPALPDFHVEAKDLEVDPVAPIPADSQLTVTVRLNNWGLVPTDSVNVELTHTTPGGATHQFMQRVPPFALQHEVQFDVPIDDAAVGENQLQVRVDGDDAYAEESELDNAVSVTQLVFSNGVTVVDPPDLGIVTERQPRLRMTLASASQQSLPLVVQLDTVPSFDSSVLTSETISASGLFADWRPPQPLEDGRTYFWRARIDDPMQPANWTGGSFTVRSDLETGGWLQQGPLFEANEQDAFLKRDGGHWAFNTYRVEIQATSEQGSGSFKGAFFVNGQRYRWRGLGFGMLVLDGNTGAFLGDATLPTYKIPSNQVERLGIDSTRAMAKLDSLVQFVPEGNYIFVNTRHLAHSGGPTIQEEVKANFRALGSTAIDTLTYHHLWIMMTRKGYPEETREWVEAPGGTNEIVQELALNFSFPEGQTTSPTIGPVKAWRTLGWSADLENQQSDVRVDVLAAQGDSVLIEDVDPTTTSLEPIDAGEHPYLRLRATLIDSSQATTPQLRQWHVAFDRPAELALDPSTFSVSADSLTDGEPVSVSVGVSNLGPTVAEQALVTYVVTDASNQSRTVGTDTLHAVPADSARVVEHTFSTAGLAGSNRVTLSVKQPGVPEPITFNNVLIGHFFVRADRTPPDYRLLIDGREMPNDPQPVVNVQDPTFPFVSAQPTIEVEIEDDNVFRPLTDTASVEMELDGQRIPFSDPNVQYEPATDGENRMRILYAPDLARRDTTHTFRVQAYDASGNEAEPYQVHFRVQSSVEVQSLYPYPNPMNTFTTFAFRLQGADPSLVEDFRLRIYTINGRLIREFDLVNDPFALDGGMLRIGWNKLRWDTRDDDGDLVASGVYLYKVFLKAEGGELEVNNSSSVEKLVVIR